MSTKLCEVEQIRGCDSKAMFDRDVIFQNILNEVEMMAVNREKYKLP